MFIDIDGCEFDISASLKINFYGYKIFIDL